MQFPAKIITLVVSLIFISVLANAQANYSKAQFSIGIDAGLPTGKVNNTQTFMLGGFVQQAIVRVGLAYGF